MTNAILLVSRGQLFEDSHAFVLREAGYRVLIASDLADAMVLAGACSMAVIGPTFSVEEQEHFVDSVQEMHSGVHIVCLRAVPEKPTALLQQMMTILGGQPSGLGLHVLHPDHRQTTDSPPKLSTEETTPRDCPSKDA